MRCPNCPTVEMDREDHVEPSSCEVYDGKTVNGNLHHAIYNCPTCGLEAIWRKGRKLEVLYDPRDVLDKPPIVSGTESRQIDWDLPPADRENGPVIRHKPHNP